MTKMLEDLAEVVLKMDAIKAAGWNADDREVIDTRVKCVEFIRTHHATITDMAKRLEAADALLSKVVTPYYDSAERIQLFKDIQSHLQESTDRRTQEGE